MIISKNVLVKLHRLNIQYYENLGYHIPRIKDKWGRMVVRRGTKIQVKVHDLPPQSHDEILCKCDCCGKERTIYFKQYRNLCHDCRMKSKETRNKCSESSWLKGKTETNSPFWKPNLTDRERKRRISGMSKWRKEVKERDKYTCQLCGYVGEPNDGTTCAHHINNFSENKDQRTSIDNGITLCKECHNKIHHIFGKKTNKEHLQYFWRKTTLITTRNRN